MEKQTALMQAIDYLRKHNLLSAAVMLEDRFLAIEKQQIVEAYEKGKKNNPLQGFHTNTVFMNGNQYFESTYKTKEAK